MPRFQSAGSRSALARFDESKTTTTSGAPPGCRVGALWIAGASMLWLLQAAALAWAVQRLAEGGGWMEVVWPAAAYAALGLARASGEARGSRLVFAAARQHVSDMRGLACAALACNSPLNRNRPASGQAASTLAEQAEALLPWLVRYEPARWRVMVVPPLIAMVVLSQSWAAGLILLGAAPLIPLAMVLIGWRAKAASEAQLRALGGMNGFLLDRLRGLSTLRALGAVDATAQRLRASAEDLRQRTMRVLRIAFLSSAALELFSALAVAFVAVYVGFHLLGQIGIGSWGRTLSLGEALFILLLAPAFFEPLRDLSAAWHDKAAGQAAQKALAALQCDATPMPGARDELRSPDAAEPAASSGPPAIQIDALQFGHTGSAPLFQELHLSIGAGEHVALVGASGSGKSSLLAIIAGLAPVSAGTVRIDGVALDHRQAAALRRRMAWVGQKPHMFPGSVHDNVALQRPQVSREDVHTALWQAGLGSLAHLTPEHSLGEGGLGLSGGEAVRLALARAVAAPQADLWLLDEPTAHLDRNTAQAVVDALLRMARGRTLVLATHDRALAARIGRVIDVDQLVCTRANRWAA